MSTPSSRASRRVAGVAATGPLPRVAAAAVAAGACCVALVVWPAGGALRASVVPSEAAPPLPASSSNVTSTAPTLTVCPGRPWHFRTRPAYGRLEMEERALHDRRGDLGGGPEAPRRLVDDDGAAGLADRRDDRLAIERGDREEVQHLGLHAILGLEHVGRLARDAQHGAVGDEREIASLADHLRRTDREGLGLLGDLLLRGVVERLRLEKDHRVGVADR